MTRYCAFFPDSQRRVTISSFREISVYGNLLVCVAKALMVDGSSIAIGAIIQEVSAEAVSGVQPQAFSSPGKPPARNLVDPASASRPRLKYE